MSHLKYYILMLLGLAVSAAGGYAHIYSVDRLNTLNAVSRQASTLTPIFEDTQRDIKLLITNNSQWHMIDIAENISLAGNVVNEMATSMPGESIGADTKIDKRIERLVTTWSKTAEVSEQIAKRTNLSIKTFNDLSSTIGAASSILASIAVSIADQRSAVKAISSASTMLGFAGAIILCVTVLYAVGSASAEKKRLMAQERKIETSASKLIGLMKRVEGGDLTAVATESTAINEDVATSFNSMIEALRSKLRIVSAMLNELNRPITTIETSTAENKEALSVVISRAADLTSTIDAINATALSLAEDGQASLHASKLSGTTLKNGSSSVTLMAERANDARNQIQNTGKRVKRLGELLVDAESAAEALSGLPERLEVMTLNASLEGTRAGDKGEGFMIIADEIKSLSIIYKESIQTVQSVIGSILTDATEINEGMNQSIQLAIDESHLVESAATSFAVGQQSMEDVAHKAELILSQFDTHQAQIGRAEAYAADIDKGISEVSSSEAEIRRVANQLEQSIARIQETIEGFKL